MLRLLLLRAEGAPPPSRFLLRALSSSSSAHRQSTTSATATETKPSDGAVTEMAASHPWPEWTELMQVLLKKGYLSSPPSRSSDASFKESNHIRTACLNFARDRPNIFRVDRKVINSAKRLRAFLGIEEANVCRTCNLRGRCERAYAKKRENNDRTTVDVMLILLTFGLVLMTASVDGKSFLNENVKMSARKLLSSFLEFSPKEPESKCGVLSEDISPISQRSSSNQLPKGQSNAQSKGDWVCAECNFVNFSRNLRCLHCNEASLEKLKKLRADREHLPLKRGDWICSKCNFLNFAKSSTCLQCNGRPKNRQLNPGEWECTSCNFINFRRNELCLRCGWKRPKAAFHKDSFPYSQWNNMHEIVERPTISLLNGNNFDQRPPC